MRYIVLVLGTFQWCLRNWTGGSYAAVQKQRIAASRQKPEASIQQPAASSQRLYTDARKIK